jgi:hypothetical protein
VSFLLRLPQATRCDGYHRDIIDVELHISSFLPDLVFRTRRLNEEAWVASPNLNSTAAVNATSSLSSCRECQDEVSALFSVRGTCRDCPVSETGSFRLFDDVISFGRSLQGARIRSAAKSFLQASQTNSSDVCVCPVGMEPNVRDGIYPEDFEIVFNNKITEIVDDGGLPSVTPVVDNVIEGNQVDCSEEILPFRSIVRVDLGFAPSELTEEKKIALEESFQLAVS